MDEQRSVRLEMTASEAAVMRTALEMLEDTLGREEADELAQVQALLRRLAAAEAG
jgi:hypothetical protein